MAYTASHGKPYNCNVGAGQKPSRELIMTSGLKIFALIGNNHPGH
jgi:hypothetical protein